MKSTRSSQCLYIASLFFLIFLTAVCIAISAADVCIQALADKTTTGKFDFRNLVVVGGTYVVLVRYQLEIKSKESFKRLNIFFLKKKALASLLFSCSRVLSVRGSMQTIPKTHIPIRKNDLPKVKREYKS